MSTFVFHDMIALATDHRSAESAHCSKKLPVPLNRPPSDTTCCVEETLGRPSRPAGPPGGDDGDSDGLRRALQRYYHALSAHQGDAMVDLERKFDRNLRTLTGQYERMVDDLSPTDRELCMIIQKSFEHFEEDVQYHARAGYESMGTRLAGRLTGPYSVTVLVEAVLQWWRNPQDRGLIKRVREAVDSLTVRRARGSIRRMQSNRAKVEAMKRRLSSMTGEVKWDACLQMLGLEANDVNMALEYVAAAEQGWRIEAGEEFNEFAVDLGADQSSERCLIFSLPLPASVKEELQPVVSIASLNDEVYGLLTGDRWFALHSSNAIFGTVVATRFIEVEEKPEMWGVIERRHRLETSVLTAKDCTWLSQLLCEDAVDEVHVLYQILTQHAQKGHLPEGKDVGMSVVVFRDELEKKKILTTSGATQLFNARTVSRMFSLTGSRGSFSRALAEMVLGTTGTSTSIRCAGRRAAIGGSIGTWDIKVTGPPNKRAKDLEIVLAALVRLVRKRGIVCRVTGVDIQEGIDDEPVFRSTEGRIGLRCHDLWYSRYAPDGRAESQEEET